jgi:Helicase conserved C-terminal domain
MVGLYETAIEALCTQDLNGKPIKPKIIASTATVRRANKQIQALFGRQHVEIFPPPGPDRRDSFFAKTVSPDEKNARLYVGIAGQGRSLKVVLLRSYLVLLGAAQKLWLEAGGAKNPKNPVDPYMTVLGYFNSLRELGGSRRIVEDEVRSQINGYHQHKRVNEDIGMFSDRKISDLPIELTSRVNTNEVAEAKGKLENTFTKPKEAVDVVLATNMISVGLDITRLGLMVILGQPKTTAEYIQASSRVGRDEERPGLVITLMNIHRPRDRSHYERFQSWHNTFYRAVEATSVTPFSPRAVDRGLAGVSVALARLGCNAMTAPKQAGMINQHRQTLAFVAETLANRAEIHDTNNDQTKPEELRQRIRASVLDLLDSWERVAEDAGTLQYQQEEGGAPPLLYTPLDAELRKKSDQAQKFTAQRSLRDVEHAVNLWIVNPNGQSISKQEES